MRPRSLTSPLPGWLNMVFSCLHRTQDSVLGTSLWLAWIGRARHPSPRGQASGDGDLGRTMGIEEMNVGRWLTHGDSAMDTDSDLLALTETGS